MFAPKTGPLANREYLWWAVGADGSCCEVVSLERSKTGWRKLRVGPRDGSRDCSAGLRVSVRRTVIVRVSWVMVGGKRKGAVVLSLLWI